MKTRIKLFNPEISQVENLNETFNIHEMETYGLNVIITAEEQLPDSIIEELLKQGNVNILTKHFWYSKKEESHDLFSKPEYPFCLINGQRNRYTQATLITKPTQEFEDLIYLGYGIVDWKNSN